MKRLLTFIVKHLAVFVFIVLEFIALIFYFNANTFHKSKFFELSTSITASTQDLAMGVFDYFSLSEVNNKLSEDNAMLMNKVAQLEDALQDGRADSIIYERLDNDVSFVSAKVVSNSIYKYKNYMILDKGADDSIKVDMGVISADGVVGVVQRVTKNYSIVMPLINTEQRVSVKIKTNKQLGSLIWKGRNNKYATMEEIPGHVKPQIGDTVVTSGYSSIFPNKLMIGVIDEVSGDDSDAFREVKVRLAVDFSTVEYVMIMMNKNKQELQELEQSLVNKEK